MSNLQSLNSTEQVTSGHLDQFCRYALPPRELWPEIDYSSLNYPLQMNCADSLLDAAVSRGFGDRVALRFPDATGELLTWSYNELLEKASQIAHVLVEDFGIIPGNRVLLRAPNNAMQAAAWFGILKAGAVVVCTMPLLRQRELQYVAERAQISLSLCDNSCPEEGLGGKALYFNTDREDGLENRMKSKPTVFESCVTAATDTALIAFTSGTTGKSKGTMHNHADVMAITDGFAKHVLKATADDIFCGSPPLAFTYSLGGLLLFPLRIGASSLLLEQASPPKLIEAIDRYRPTVCFTAPTAYRAMLSMLDRYDISSLTRCVSAGETLPLATFEAWQSATGLKIIDGIGATEMLHIFISASGDEIRPGATGKVVPGYTAKIIDEYGNDVPTGVMGRLAVKGPTGCRYLDDVQRQQQYVQDGWNITGDSYIADADGYFWYQARTDDMIISSGHNISGPEVENVLLDHPAVKECAVIGTPDADRGHIVTAFIVLADDYKGSPPQVKELQDYVKAEIAPYKYPRKIHFIGSLPRTDTGKLQRAKLREQITEAATSNIH